MLLDLQDRMELIVACLVIILSGWCLVGLRGGEGWLGAGYSELVRDCYSRLELDVMKTGSWNKMLSTWTDMKGFSSSSICVLAYISIFSPRTNLITDIADVRTSTPARPSSDRTCSKCLSPRSHQINMSPPE